MKNVLVLMSTYNGEKYIYEQLESIKKQININVDLIIRDDGSIDNTKYLINKFISENIYPQISLFEGENIGFVKSFFELAKISYSSERKYDFYAFSDQDDYWLENKIEEAVLSLEKLKLNKPSLYFCQPQRVDEYLNPLPTKGLSLFNSFGESLILHCATGCTEVFNYELIKVVVMSLKRFPSMHDSYFHQVCLAIGGEVVFDKRSFILYRQHSNNVIGGKEKFFNQWKRRYEQFYYKRANERSKNAELLLFNLSTKILSNNISHIKQIIEYKNSFSAKFKLLTNKEIRSKSLSHNINFFISVLTNQY